MKSVRGATSCCWLGSMGQSLLLRQGNLRSQMKRLLTVVFVLTSLPFFFCECNDNNIDGVSLDVGGAESHSSNINSKRSDSSTSSRYMKKIAEGKKTAALLSSSGEGEQIAEERKPLFTPYEVCDLSKPHEILGLPALSSNHPPSAQDCWVAYYSRVIVAEHQPKDFSLYKLYCSAMATKKLLYEIDPDRYFHFIPTTVDDKYFNANGDPHGESAESIQEELTASVESGNEVEAMLLHPDIFDSTVAKALMSLGWQEMKFYDVDNPVWLEWLKDEDDERLSWVQHMDKEIGKIEKEIETVTEKSVVEQLRWRSDSISNGMVTAQSLVERSSRSSSATAEANGIESTLFRRLEGRRQYTALLEELQMRKNHMESGKREMVKVNARWERQRDSILMKWENFLEGALDRVEANETSPDGVMSWEEAVDRVAQKFSEDSDGSSSTSSRDYCEGYLLESVLQENRVLRINGKAWIQQSEKDEAFRGIVDEHEEEKEDEVGVSGAKEIEDVILLGSYSSSTRDASPDSFQLVDDVGDIDFFDGELSVNVDELVDELLQDSGGLDIDLDEIISELEKMNEEDIISKVTVQATSSEAAAAAADAMFAGMTDVIDGMVEREGEKRDVNLKDIDELLGLLFDDYDSDDEDAAVSSLEQQLHTSLVEGSSSSDHPKGYPHQSSANAEEAKSSGGTPSSVLLLNESDSSGGTAADTAAGLATLM